MSEQAVAIRAIPIIRSYFLEGNYWLETECADYDVWRQLPVAVEFGGRSYGKAGWNSDSCRACYSTYRRFATY